MDKKKIGLDKGLKNKIRFYDLYQKIGLFVIAFVMIVTFSILTKGVFCSPTNIKNVLIQTSVNGIVSIGVAVVILTAGIDLSVGGIAVFATIIGAILIRDGLFWPFGMLLILLFGAFWGFINGISVAKFKMNPFITTLAIMNITKGIAIVLSKGYTIYGFPKVISFFGQGKILYFPTAGFIFIFITILVSIILNNTRFGWNIYNVGGNSRSSLLSGINVDLHIISAYIISGITAALGGIILMARLLAVHVNMVTNLELDAISAVVIGGVSLFGGEGNISGVFIGVLIIGIISNGLNLVGVSPYWQQVVKGVIIFIAVYLDVQKKKIKYSE
jgi:ribose transport system permease protein